MSADIQEPLTDAQGRQFFVNSSGDYTAISADGSIIIDAQGFRWKGDALDAHLRLTRDTGEVVGPVDISFLSPTSRREVLRVFGEGDETAATLNWLARCVVDRERENTSPVVTLADVPRPTPDREYIVPLLPPLPRAYPAIWYGDGGTGKSLKALYAAGHLAMQGVRVLYLDWELDQDEQRLRFEQIFGAGMPKLLKYHKCDKPLAQSVGHIRQVIQRHHAEYVICDSLAYACGGPPEQSEVAVRYMMAVRQLGIGSLHIAHVSKSGDTTKPFGSVYWHNGARSTWYIEATEQDDQGDVTVTRLEWQHNKTNFGPREGNRYLTVTIAKNRGPYKLSKGMAVKRKQGGSMAESIGFALENGPMTREELKAALNIRATQHDTFRRTVNRLKKDGKTEEDPNTGKLHLA